MSEFQAELVQMAATLNGDHTRDVYPDKLVENLTVADAAKYCNDAFKIFLDECQKAKESSMDPSQVVCVPNSSTRPLPERPSQQAPKSFAQKIFSCLTCDQ